MVLYHDYSEYRQHPSASDTLTQAVSLRDSCSSRLRHPAWHMMICTPWTESSCGTIHQGDKRRRTLWLLLADLRPMLQHRVPSDQGRAHSRPIAFTRSHLDWLFCTRWEALHPVGAHWVPAKAAMQWPMEWGCQVHRGGLPKMHQLGSSIDAARRLWRGSSRTG